MIQAISMTKGHFPSACYRTPEYLTWHRVFKRSFTRFLRGRGVDVLRFSNPNHFDMSGFFVASSGRIWYFSISDLRWSKADMLLRTAKDFSDYTGGTNCYASLDTEAQFEKDFHRITGV